MKLLFPVLFLCSGLVFGQKTVPSDYKKIPEILDNPELLFPFIVPDKKYDYWSVLRNNPDPDKAVIYESQAPDFMTLNDPAPEKGFFQKCLGEDCFSYLLACEKGKTKYFSTEQQLRNFIGTVDNLQEAILIANTYGYTVDTGNISGSSYTMDDKNIFLYLSKLANNAKNKESFFIKINRKTGKIEIKSNGTY
ncbi:hypothetical protein [Chryseobacterium taeanense]|uniref:hypothetical protein n=1 Tax=Chryseobacterium taeanense TaxID=311334 RepID=UPI0035B1D70B